MTLYGDASSYLRQRGIPNFLHTYLMTRKLPETWTPDQKAADLELYDFWRGWLTATALAHCDSHMMDQSGHLVWKDLVDKFLARTPERQNAIDFELSHIEAKSNESVPRFFVRIRNLQTKYTAVGGVFTERQLVMKAAQVLGGKSTELAATIDNILDNHSGCDSFELETRIMQKHDLQRARKGSAAMSRAKSAMAHASVQQAIAAAEANMAAPNVRPPWQSRKPPDNAGGQAQNFQRPWERPQRNPHDRSGIGNSNSNPNPAARPRARPWQNWKGGSKQAAMAQLAEDYHAQVAAVEQSYGTTEQPPSNQADAFDSNLALLADAASPADAGPFHFSSHTFVAPDNIHVVLTTDSQQRLTTPNTESDDPTMDSGTTHNIWTCRDDFGEDFTPCQIPITHAGNKQIYSEGHGTVVKTLSLPSGRTKLHSFTNSLFVPGASRCLIATTELEDQGHEVRFKKDASALILSDGTRIPLRSQGRLRLLPLHRPAAPILRKSGWRSLPSTGDKELAHLLGCTDNHPYTPDSRADSPSSTVATSGYVHPSRKHLHEKRQR